MVTWWTLALAISFASCIFLNLNKKFQLDGLRARGWSTFFAASYLSPILFFIYLPTDPAFYLCAFIAGCMMSFVGEIYFNLGARYGGPVASLSRPFGIICSFIVWAAYDWQNTLIMLSDPIVGFGILAAFTLAMWGQMRLVKDNKSIKTAIKALVAAALIGGLVSPITKFGMEFTITPQQALVWTFFFHVSGSAMCFLRHCLRNTDDPIVTKKHLHFGYMIGLYNALFGPMYAYAVLLAPNPSFIGLVVMLTTVWLMIYYKLRGQDALVRPKAVAMLLTAVTVLVFTTRGL